MTYKMKTTKKKKKTSNTMTRSKLIKELDKQFSLFIRMRDANKKGIVTCPLCWAKMPWQKAQNMHFIKRSVMAFRWDEDNCHAGCMRCNVILNGNYIEYTRWMQKKYGIETIDEAIRKSKEVCKISTPEILEMITYYRGQNENLAYKFLIH